MTQQIEIAGTRAWLKQYGQEHRRVRLAVLDMFSRQFGLAPLCPPPHHVGPAAKLVEKRRLAELRTLDIRVPEVLAEGESMLVLSDIGPTLSHELGRCEDDPLRVDALVDKAVEGIAEAHARGAYFGQPWPRNLTLERGRVGFLDFEEDPLDVMTLEQAQARDWLLFAYGTARYYAGRSQALEQRLRDGMDNASRDAAMAVGEVASRLGFMVPLLRSTGRSARSVARAVSSLQRALLPLLVMAVAIGVDWIHDGQIELLEILL